MSKIRITPEDLQNHLQEQISFLITSARAFDEGFHSEAKRLATTIRVLVHEGGRSTSLLKQLEDRFDLSRFVSIKMPPPDLPVDVTPAIPTEHRLVNLTLAGGPPAYRPWFNRDEFTKIVPFEQWWNDIAIQDKYYASFTRRDLVLTMANQDGGAHIDPTLSADYRMLTKLNSMGMTFGAGGYHWEENPVPACVRQIAHEMLRTLQLQAFFIPNQVPFPCAPWMHFSPTHQPVLFSSPELIVPFHGVKIDLGALHCARLEPDWIQGGALCDFVGPGTEISFKGRVEEHNLKHDSIGRRFSREEIQLAMLFAIRDGLTKLSKQKVAQPLDLAILKDKTFIATYFNVTKAFSVINKNKWHKGRQWILSTVEECERNYGLKLWYPFLMHHAPLSFFHNGHRVLHWSHAPFIEACAPVDDDDPEAQKVADTQRTYETMIEAAFQDLLSRKRS